MIPEEIKEVIHLADGREIEISTGRLAKQANGSVVIKSGGTMLLATVVASKDAKEGVDFLPLTVDYREKFAAGGKIPGGFFKREARPSDSEVLTMRLVDRVLRPLFPKDFHAEIQVMIQLMSFDGSINPDALAGLGASAALTLTDIPFDGPISEARVVRKNGAYIINPSMEDMDGVDIDMMVGASADSVAMVEGEMSEISEQEMIDAIQVAHEAIKDQIAAQLRLAERVGAPTQKRKYSHETHDEELRELVKSETYDALYAAATNASSKEERFEKFEAILEQFATRYSEEELAEKKGMLKGYFAEVKKEAVRNMVLDQGVRLDGRGPTDIRPIWSLVDYLPGAHGSALFTRGETQSITTVTLGSSLDANRVDNVTFQGEEKFYLHYNFPPFSTGEARPIRGTSRREIGHGNLAQRALYNMIPAENPYTIRVVSDILESNGSSSMATVCAGTLALMDAGIAMKKPVSGIAMGLITDGDSGKWKVLSDILGDEDHLGDMDFKVTGTKDGITACQMDIKVKGLSYEILEKALLQAKDGRLHIMDRMLETLAAPRPELKPNAPKIVTIRIASDYIGAVIGPGGKNIQGLQAETGTHISITEDGDFGIVEIAGVDPEGMRAAEQAIADITFEPTEGEVYKAIVKSIKPFGAFVEIKKGTEGLVHISEIEWKRLEKVEDALELGQEIEVKFIGLDPKTKKMRLSRKVLLPRPERGAEKA